MRHFIYIKIKFIINEIIGWELIGLDWNGMDWISMCGKKYKSKKKMVNLAPIKFKSK